MNKLGMTMVEMIAVILIVSVVSSVALPAVDNFRSSDRCKAEASKLVDSIRLAKYSAMEENTLNRIAFSPDGDAYKVQKYEGNKSTFFEAIQADHASDVSKYDLDDSIWTNISGEDEETIDTSIEANLDDLANKCLYFQPDGYIYCWDSGSNKVQFISEKTIEFKRGSSAIAVAINSLGVLSSEAISVDEGEFFEDDSSEDETENPSTGGGDTGTGGVGGGGIVPGGPGRPGVGGGERPTVEPTLPALPK